jgi:hypothetical protein
MALDDREIYFETLVVGDVARIAAIDAATGIEALATGPASAARHDLERLARRMLERLLRNAGVIEGDSDSQAPSSEPRAEHSARRGKLV